MRRGAKVAVLGGGVAGLSAAHELAERGFRVTLVERRDMLGGKARTIGVPSTGQGGRRDLPGEHGFRFFPRFYRHVTDTMRRIPYGRHPNGVLDNLVDTSRMGIAESGQPLFVNFARFPRTPDDLRVAMRAALGWRYPLTRDDGRRLVRCMWRVLSTCSERRAAELDGVSWAELAGMSTGTGAYQSLMGLTQLFVALRAESISACTTGSIATQMFRDLARPGPSSDRVLNGPTSEVWLDPWRMHLQHLGVELMNDAALVALPVEQGRVAGAELRTGRGRTWLHADHYVVALPVDVAASLVTPELLDADPRLAGIPQLAARATGWMVGAQLFLSRAPELPHGHIVHLDTPWALTSVMHQPFWTEGTLHRFGAGNVQAVLSVDVSSWDTPGLHGKTARECTAQQLRREIWEQLCQGLTGPHALHEGDVVAWMLDPAVTPAGPQGLATNDDRLFVNTAGIRALRPHAATRLPNLALAADWVATHTDLGSMEGANEAARRAVNCILDRVGSHAERCGVWRLREPWLTAPLRAVDRVAFVRGRRWPWGRSLVPEREAAPPRPARRAAVPPSLAHAAWEGRA